MTARNVASTITITRLGPKDAARGAALFAAILDEDWLPEGTPDAEHVRKALSDASTVLMVATLAGEGAGRDVGFAVAFRLRSPLKLHDEAYLDDLFVAEAHRGRGIGAALLESVKGEFAGRGVPVLWTATDADNEPMAALLDGQQDGERTDDVLHYALGLPVKAEVRQ